MINATMPISFEKENMVNATMPPSFDEGQKRKKGGRYAVHPLFFLVGVYYSLTGRLTSFLLSAFVAIEHELCHAFAAEKRGYRLSKIVLMPYGAVIGGDLTDCERKDEIAVAIAGPLGNLLTAALFVALWWLFPSAYPYTDSACFLSVWTAIVNLLPVYPLDGGRVLFAFLRGGKEEKKAKKISFIVSLVFVLFLFVLFFLFWAQGSFHIGLCCFCLFLLCSLFGGEKGNYEKLSFSNEKMLLRGAEIKQTAVSTKTSLYRATRFIERGRYLFLLVYDEEERLVKTIGQGELAELFERGDYRSKLGDFL